MTIEMMNTAQQTMVMATIHRMEPHKNAITFTLS